MIAGGRIPRTSSRRTKGLAIRFVAVALGAFTTSATKSAEAAPFDLDWKAPAGCPSRDEIVASTRARLGAGASNDAPAELFLHGEVVRDSGGYAIALRMNEAGGKELGERELRVDDSNCSAIKEPTSLVIAMMIAVARPQVETTTPPSAETPPAPPPQTPLPARISSPSAPRAITPPPRTPPPKEPFVFAASASAVASVGFLPHVGLGGALRFTVAPPSSILVFGLETSFETSPAARAGGGQVRFDLAEAAALFGLRVLRRGRFELVPMASASGGVIWTHPSGFPVIQRDVRPAALVGLGALGRVALGRHVRFELFPELRVPIFREKFEVREGDHIVQVHQPSVLEARLTMGFGWEIP
ncbi:hypothetical protein AKJ09_01458 [Labilithrix luteola]|uniref:Uncharacterized protein n=1 Tax=Labilithrix luteola TaxID=1391654 RepID=A0A0K1PNV6_9BACT|nr:hypothetical protein [Labilithrix luteola]AKU94794.1 hypothetical protein AKJ09_01458 [Labilithrix luteola]